MVRSADPPSQRHLKPDERRRPTLQRASDDIRDAASSSKDAKPSKNPEQGKKFPEVHVRSDKSCQTDSRRPPQPSTGLASIPESQEEERSPSPTPPLETFTHLRRNAVSDGIPYGDYRYLTGGRSEYECLQDAYRQKKADPLPYTGQERGARSRNISTETVWNGESGGAVEDVDEKADGRSRVDKDLRKGWERRSSGLEEKGAKRQG